jgi:signal transducer and activator of transcription 5B
MAPGMMSAGLAADTTAIEILQQLEIFRGRTQVTCEELRKLEQEQESFALQYHECSKLQGL